MARIGAYEVIREIGRGGMGVVYLAEQPALRRSVALKQLWQRFAGDENSVARFLEESRMTGSLAHPNIVTVFDYFEDDGSPCIAMEYIPRGSLRPHVGQLTLAQIAGVAEGVLSGLAHAHAQSIVHRDLKPENVMVTDDGRVKITDFGIAKATEEGSRSFETATGVTVGTPTYMAPEQAMGKDLGPWTDLYSVGIMLYEQVVGQVPFHDSTTSTAILLRHVSETIPPAKEVSPEVDAELSDWIDALLVKDPAGRTRTATAAWESLEDVVVRLLGPLWRRNARLAPSDETRVIAPPLTPAPFAEHAPAGSPPTSLTPVLPVEEKDAALAGSPPTSLTPVLPVPPAEETDAALAGSPPSSLTPPPLVDEERADRPLPAAPAPEPLVDVEDDTVPAAGAPPTSLTPAPLVDVDDDAPPGGAPPTTVTPADADSGETRVIPPPTGRPRVRPPAPPPPAPPPPAPPAPDAGPPQTPAAVPASSSADPPAGTKNRRTMIIVVAVLVVLAVIAAFATSGGDPADDSASDQPTTTTEQEQSSEESTDGEEASTEPTVQKARSVGEAPHAIAVGSSGVWVTNGPDGNVQHIDPSDARVTDGVVDVSTAASGIAVDDGNVWVTNKVDGELTRIDPSNGEKDDHGPWQLDHPLNNVALSEGFVWMTSVDDDLLIAFEPSSEKKTEIEVGDHPVGLAVGSDAVWVANRGSNSVTRVDLESGDKQSIDVCSEPIGVAVNGSDVWVTCFGDDKLAHIDADSRSVDGDPIKVGDGPQGVAADSSYVWVANYKGSDISQVDVAEKKEKRRIEVGSGPLNVARDDEHVWVTTDDGVVPVTPHD